MVEKVIEGGVGVFKTMSLSEGHRYVVTLGRVKETSTELPSCRAGQSQWAPGDTLCYEWNML